MNSASFLQVRREHNMLLILILANRVGPDVALNDDRS